MPRRIRLSATAGRLWPQLIAMCLRCLVMLQNNMTALQAAALASAQAALNPALQPLLLAGGNPWLQLGLVNPAGGAAPPLSQLPSGVPAPAMSPMLDMSLAAHLQQLSSRAGVFACLPARLLPGLSVSDKFLPALLHRCAQRQLAASQDLMPVATPTG